MCDTYRREPRLCIGFFIAESTHRRQETLLKSVSQIWGSGQVSRNRLACDHAGGASFDWKVLELGQLWYRVEGQEKAQRNFDLAEFDLSDLY